MEQTILEQEKESEVVRSLLENARMKQQWNDDTVSNEHLIEMIGTLEREKNHLNDVINKRGEQNTRLQKKINQLHAEYDIDVIAKQKDTATIDELEDKQEIIRRLQDEMAVADLEIDSLNKEVDRLQKAVGHNEISRLELDVSEMDSDWKHMVEDFHRRETEYTMEIAGLKYQIQCQSKSTSTASLESEESGLLDVVNTNLDRSSLIDATSVGDRDYAQLPIVGGQEMINTMKKNLKERRESMKNQEEMEVDHQQIQFSESLPELNLLRDIADSSHSQENANSDDLAMRMDYARVLAERQELLEEIRKRDAKILKFVQLSQTQRASRRASMSSATKFQISVAHHDSKEILTRTIKSTEHRLHGIRNEDKIEVDINAEYESLPDTIMDSEQEILRLIEAVEDLRQFLTVSEMEKEELLSTVKRKDRVLSLQKQELDSLRSELIGKMNMLDAALEQNWKMKDNTRELNKSLNQRTREVNGLNIDNLHISEELETTQLDHCGSQGMIVGLEDLVHDLRTMLEAKEHEIQRLKMSPVNHEEKSFTKNELKTEIGDDQRAGTGYMEGTFSAEFMVIALRNNLAESQRTVLGLKKRLCAEEKQFQAMANYSLNLERVNDELRDLQGRQRLTNEVQLRVTKSQVRLRDKFNEFQSDRELVMRATRKMSRTSKKLKRRSQKLSNDVQMFLEREHAISEQDAGWSLRAALSLFVVAVLTLVSIQNPGYFEKKLSNYGDSIAHTLGLHLQSDGGYRELRALMKEKELVIAEQHESITEKEGDVGRSMESFSRGLKSENLKTDEWFIKHFRMESERENDLLIDNWLPFRSESSSIEFDGNVRMEFGRKNDLVVDDLLIVIHGLANENGKLTHKEMSMDLMGYDTVQEQMADQAQIKIHGDALDNIISWSHVLGNCSLGLLCAMMSWGACQIVTENNGPNIRPARRRRPSF